MKIGLGAVGALALLIAACGADAENEARGETVSKSAEPTEQAADVSDTPTPSPSPTSDDDAEEPEDSETAEPKAVPTRATVTNAIPARFHGVWDYVEGTCARESDARKEISAKEIMFYESIGTVTSVTAEGDDVLVGLDMEGEGETWTQVTRLSLSGSGANERLNTSDGEKPKIDNNFPSKRCAA